MNMLKDSALTFNYAGWPANTKITMTNVPWNNDYRDVIKFENRAALDAYIDATPDKFAPDIMGTYAKLSAPIKVNVPFEVAQQYNYLRATNPARPIPGGTFNKSFYYFIIGVDYKAGNTTELTLQLDVWQSYVYDIELGQSYVEKGHIGIANSLAFSDYGRQYLTVPEGMDIGSEYLTVAYRNRKIASVEQVAGGSDSFQYFVMITSTVDLQADSGTFTAPKLETAPGGTVQGMPTGADVYIMPAVELPFFLKFLKNKPWVTQGITSIQAIPPYQNFGYSATYFIVPGSSGQSSTGGSIQIARITGRGGKPIAYQGITNWRTSTDVINYIPERYRHLKKFLTFPYTAIEVTMFNGKPLILKPESWNDPSCTLDARIVLLPPQQKLVITPRSYNAVTGAAVETYNGEGGLVFRGDDGGDFLDVSTYIDNFPTFATVNDSWLAFMAQNNNSLWAQNLNNEWAQQRALAANNLSYDQAGAAMDLIGNLANTANWADQAQVNLAAQGNILGNLVQSGGNIIGGAAGGGAIGGPAGVAAGAAAGAGSAIMSGLGTALGNGQSQAAQNIRQSASQNSVAAQKQAGSFMRETNKGFADWAARGDYQAANTAMNAKIQDARLIQPTVSGQAGGEAFNLIYNAMNVSIRYKMIDLAAIRMIGDHWLRYGYAVHRFMQMPASLHVMSKFTYWKLSETYIKSGRMPESMKQVIRGILEKGVTVWQSPNDIGNIDIAANVPLEGISY